MKNIDIGPLRSAMNVLSLMYFVISAKYASAGEFILSSKKIIEGEPPIGYPKGGIGKIAEALSIYFKKMKEKENF